MSASTGDLRGVKLRIFKRYPAYKESGIEWVRRIPEHWQVRRLKTIALARLSNVDKKSVDGQVAIRLCNYVDVYHNDRITEDLEFMQASATREQIRRFSLRAGDVLITKDSESWSDIAVPAVVVSDMPEVLCGYHLALIRPGGSCHGAFLSRAFSAVGLRDQLEVAANGITRFGLGTDVIGRSVFPAPPIDEQRAIAAFLDRETARIDALVAKKDRLIELLEEERAAIVTRAVTRGLDRNRPMKESGVAWLGEIPAHWAILTSRRLINRIEQGWSPVAEDRQAGPDEWAVIKLSAVSKGRFRADEHKALPVGLAPDVRFEILEDDFLLTRSNTPDFVGDVCVAKGVRGRLMLCDLVYRLHLAKERVNPMYLAYWLLSKAGRYQIEVDARGASQSMVKISQGIIRAWAVPLPPLEEQRAIVGFLDAETARIDSLIAAVSRAIDRVEELRSALISTAVTGQIDVREEVA